MTKAVATATPERPAIAALPPMRRLSPSQAAWLLVQEPANLTEGEHAALEMTQKAVADIATAYTLAQDFIWMVRDRTADAQAAWIYATTSWPTYLGLQAQMIAACGFFIFCPIIDWVFGREFTDGTLKDMLAVPVPRASIVLAKFAVVAAWSAAVAVLICVTGLVAGALMRLPQASPGVLLQGSLLMAITTCLTIAVVLPFAFLASVGRGYLLPIGLAVLALMLANLMMVLGWGEYFPWAVPGLHAQGKGYLGPISYPIAILTGAIGMLGTRLWWKYADQNR